MIKAVKSKCTLIVILAIPYTLNAQDHQSFRLKSLGTTIPKTQKIKQHKQFFLDKINEFIGDDIDLTLFDNKKNGWSVYAKISKVSRVGLRYNY